MASELLPCPFCGVSMADDDCDHDENCYIKLLVKVWKDGGKSSESNLITVLNMIPNLITAWNTRAERTCKMVVKSNERPGKTVFNQWHACSECGKPMNPSDNYCPSCGARVVGD